MKSLLGQRRNAPAQNQNALSSIASALQAGWSVDLTAVAKTVAI
jgi:hypothetical protein